MLQVENVSKEYPTPRGALKIVSDISLSLSRGDAVSIMGPSGSGKSTLLYIMGALEPPTQRDRHARRSESISTERERAGCIQE